MTLAQLDNTATEKPRDGKGNFVRTPEQIELDHQAAKLRSQSKTFKEIAQHFGCSVGTAFNMVHRAIQDIPREGTEELIALELAKLDVVEAKAYEIMTKHHAYVSPSGKVVYDDGERLQDDGPVLAAMDRLLKVASQRAKLLGLNAPTRTELTGKDGGAIEIADRSKEAKDSVLQLLARLSA
jgi:hypothetical protein